MHWYFDVFKKYAVFDGRARRTEYWMFVLFNILVFIGFLIIDNVSGLTKATNGLGPPLSTLYSLAVSLPALGVSVRRLHDTGHSGWWILIALIPLIGDIILLAWMKMDGDSGTNAYGPNPKALTAA